MYLTLMCLLFLAGKGPKPKEKKNVSYSPTWEVQGLAQLLPDFLFLGRLLSFFVSWFPHLLKEFNIIMNIKQ